MSSNSLSLASWAVPRKSHTPCPIDFYPAGPLEPFESGLRIFHTALGDCRWRAGPQHGAGSGLDVADGCCELGIPAVFLSGSKVAPDERDGAVPVATPPSIR